MNNNDILIAIADLLEQRKGQDASESYASSLFEKGLEAIAKKISEEATETILAAKDADPEQIIYETADLWFHTLVLLSHQGLRPEQVLSELQRRFGVSGLAEKASRNNK